LLHLVAFNLGDSAKKGLDPRIVGVPVTSELARTKYLLETRKRAAFIHWMIINRRAAELGPVPIPAEVQNIIMKPRERRHRAGVG
jgi:hypothetical protein